MIQTLRKKIDRKTTLNLEKYIRQVFLSLSLQMTSERQIAKDCEMWMGVMSQRKWKAFELEKKCGKYSFFRWDDIIDECPQKTCNYAEKSILCSDKPRNEVEKSKRE